MNIATQLAIVKVLTDLLKAQAEQLKTAARGEMERGDRKTAMLGSEKIASISMTDPKPRAKVTDETAFIRWVIDNHPAEIVESVRESYRKIVLDQCSANGAAVDTNGEVVAGVTVDQGDPYPSVRLATGAHKTISEAYRGGHLPDLGALLAIEGGGDE